MGNFKIDGELLKLIRDTEPKNRDDLRNYIRLFFDFNIPHVQVCNHHTTPLDFLYKTYFGDSSNILAIGERDGYKTLCVSILVQLMTKFRACSVLQAGAIELQAMKGYEYFQKYYPKVQPGNVISSLMSKTNFYNGAKVMIAPATENRMNSEHLPLLILDELELMNPKAYSESKGIPARQKSIFEMKKLDGSIIEKEIENAPKTVKITSRKRAFGIAQTEMDNAKDLGLDLMLWCYKETTENCPVSRRGSQPQGYWIDRESLVSISDEEYQNLSVMQKSEYDRFTAFEGCAECPLLPSCCGDLSRAGGIKRIDDQIKIFMDSPADFWISQKESRRAMGEGGVFTKYLKNRHYIDRDYELNPVLPIFRASDLGHRVSNVVYAQVNTAKRKPEVHFFEFSEYEDLNTKGLVQQYQVIDQKWGISERNVRRTFPDAHHGNQKRSSADFTDIQIMQSKKLNGYADIKCSWKYESINAGLDIIKEFLKIVCGEQFVFFYRGARGLYERTQQYSWKYNKKYNIFLDEPDENQPCGHGVDALRYMMVNLFTINKQKINY